MVLELGDLAQPAESEHARFELRRPSAGDDEHDGH